MKKTILVSTIFIIIAAIIFTLYNNKAEIDNNKILKNTFANGVAVTTAKATHQEIDNKLSLVGSTIPIRESQIPAQTSGEITNMNFKIGDRVAKGSILAKIDDKLKQLAYENAKIALDKIETDLNKIKNMYERNAASETQYREIKFAYENAKIALEQTKRQLEYTKVVAPFSGIITQKLIEHGSYVNPGVPVCYVVDMSSLKIALSVSENDAYKLKEGKTVKVTSSVYPTAEYTGLITYISPKADRGHNYPIEISIGNNNEFPLKSGTIVSVGIEFESKRNPLLIPRQSLIGSINDAKVYTIQNGVACLKNIKIGGEYDKYIEIIEGINEGDEIVTSGQMNLENNIKVRVVNN